MLYMAAQGRRFNGSRPCGEPAVGTGRLEGGLTRRNDGGGPGQGRGRVDGNLAIQQLKNAGERRRAGHQAPQFRRSNDILSRSQGEPVCGDLTIGVCGKK